MSTQTGEGVPSGIKSENLSVVAGKIMITQNKQVTLIFKATTHFYGLLKIVNTSCLLSEVHMYFYLLQVKINVF